MNKKTKAPKADFSAFPCMIIAVFISLMPLLTMPISITLTQSELLVIPNSSGEITDIFLRFREIILFSVGVCLLLFWLGERIFPDNPVYSPLIKEKSARLPLICCGVYLLLTVISAVFSANAEVSFWGIASENEGVAAVLGYIVLFLAAFNWLRGNNLRFLKYAVIAAAGAVSALFIAEKIASAAIGRVIFGYEDNRAGMSLLFGNSIACGEYCVVLFPVLFLCGTEENRRLLSAAEYLLAGFMLCVTVFSRSSSAAVGFALAVILAAALLIIRRKSVEWKKLIYSPLVLVPLAIMIVFDTQGTLKSLRTQAENSGTYNPSESCRLNDIDISNSEVTLFCQNCRVTIALTNENNAVITGTDNELLGELNNSSIALSGSYAPISVSLNERLLTLDLGYKDTIEFETTGGRPVYIGLNGYLVEEPAKSAFPQLSGYYSFGTGRGYIWLTSIPLLKDSIFKGCGAGQFAFRFPQDDIVGMLSTHGTTAVCTDKPHNMYIQTAIVHGIPALLAFISLMLAVIVRSIKKKGSTGCEYGIFISVICMLIMGVFNDSNVIYSPLLWVFAGAACVNRKDDVNLDK